MEMMLAILGISTILGYITSAAAEGFNSQEATDEKNKKQGYYETQQAQEESYLQTQLENEKAALDAQKASGEEYLKTSLENALEQDAAAFKLSKQEANEQVDKDELVTNQTERTTSASFNDAISDLSLSQSQRAASYNSAAMQIGAQKGSELAAIGNSGIRAGGSLSQAVELESAVNAAQLQQQEEAQSKSDSNQLGSLFNSLGNAQFDIWNSRDTADKTRASWEAGGYNYEKDQLQRKSYQDSYDLSMKKLSDTYNLQLSELNADYDLNLTKVRDSYGLRIKQLQDEYDDYMSNSSYWKRMLSGTFNFGSSYANSANKLSEVDFSSGLSDIASGNYQYGGSFDSASSLINYIKTIKIGG